MVSLLNTQIKIGKIFLNKQILAGLKLYETWWSNIQKKLMGLL